MVMGPKPTTVIWVRWQRSSQRPPWGIRPVGTGALASRMSKGPRATVTMTPGGAAAALRCPRAGIGAAEPGRPGAGDGAHRGAVQHLADARVLPVGDHHRTVGRGGDAHRVVERGGGGRGAVTVVAGRAGAGDG